MHGETLKSIICFLCYVPSIIS